MNDTNSNITSKVAQQIEEEVGRILVGQDEFLHLLLVCLFTGGHVLIEGVPGLGKTLSARALSEAVDADFHRIQFTPDMMPSDITGTNIYDMDSQSFHLKKGPLFTNFLLADEINRTPPKTQSALLEAMEESKISIDGTDYMLEDPFIVFATQNPVEFEGTYPLPEAQLDRFLMKLLVRYPEAKDELKLLHNYHNGFNARKLETMGIKKIITKNIIRDCKNEINRVRVEDSIMEYIMSIVSSTRESHNLLLGASPRASIALLLSAKALAAMEGRDYVIPDDIQYLALPVLRHRLIVLPESEIDGVKPDDVIRQILSSVKVPR